MKTIYLLPQLSIEDSMLCVAGSPVPLRQGDIDGACGPYSLLMTLIIKKVISNEDVLDLGSYDGRTRFGMFFDRLKLFGSMFREGSNYEEMEWLAECFKNHPDGKVSTKVYPSLSLRGNLKQIAEELDSGNPVIVGLQWKKDKGHWAVAIGYEMVGKTITKIFTLDPGHQYIPNTYWNAVISAFDDNDVVKNNGQYSCDYLVVGSDRIVNCKVSELIAVKVKYRESLTVLS